MKNKKVIVSGGSGFTGSNLVEGVLENNKVTIIDDHSTDSPDNIQHLIAMYLTLISDSITDPEASNCANITGTVRVLISTRDTGVEKAIYTCISSLYSDRPVLPKSEDLLMDPYHSVHKFGKIGHHLLVILPGRTINDSMSKHAAGMMIGD